MTGDLLYPRIPWWFHIATSQEPLMANLTIKNLPGTLYEQLKQSAAQHRRSLNSEVIVCLERALHNTRIDTQAVRTKARALREKTSGYRLTDKVIFKAKNEGRP